MSNIYETLAGADLDAQLSTQNKVDLLQQKKQEKLNRLGDKSQYSNLTSGYTELPNGLVESNANKIWNEEEAANLQATFGDIIGNSQLFTRDDGSLYQLRDGQEVDYTGDTRRFYQYGVKGDDNAVKFGLARGDLPSSDYRYQPDREPGYGWDAGENGVDLNKKYLDVLLPYEQATKLEALIHGNKNALENRQYQDVLAPDALEHASGTSEYYTSVEGALGDSSDSGEGVNVLDNYTGDTRTYQEKKQGVSTPIESLREAIKQRESSGDYKAENKLGYIGAYQFGAARLADLGYVKEGTKNSDLGNADVWTGKDGITSKEVFLNSNDVQDSIATEHFNDLAKQLAEGATDEKDLLGKMAAAHLLGVQGSKDLDAVDANETSGREYYDLGVGAFEGTSTTDSLDRELQAYADSQVDLGKIAKAVGARVLSSTADAVDALFDAGANVGQNVSEYLTGEETTQEDLSNLEKLGFRVDADGRVRHYWSFEDKNVSSMEAAAETLGADMTGYQRRSEGFNNAVDSIWEGEGSTLGKIGKTVATAFEYRDIIPQGVADSLAFMGMLYQQPVAMLAGTTNQHLDERFKITGKEASVPEVLGVTAASAVELGTDFIVDKMTLGIGKTGVGAINRKLVDGLLEKVPDSIKERIFAKVLGKVASIAGRGTLAMAEEAPTEMFQEALGLLTERVGTEKFDQEKFWGLLDDETKKQIRHAGYQGALVGAGQSIVGDVVKTATSEAVQGAKKIKDVVDTRKREIADEESEQEFIDVDRPRMKKAPTRDYVASQEEADVIRNEIKEFANVVKQNDFMPTSKDLVKLNRLDRDFESIPVRFLAAGEDSRKAGREFLASTRNEIIRFLEDSSEDELGKIELGSKKEALEFIENTIEHLDYKVSNDLIRKLDTIASNHNIDKDFVKNTIEEVGKEATTSNRGYITMGRILAEYKRNPEENAEEITEYTARLENYKASQEKYLDRLDSFIRKVEGDIKSGLLNTSNGYVKVGDGWQFETDIKAKKGNYTINIKDGKINNATYNLARIKAENIRGINKALGIDEVVKPEAKKITPKQVKTRVQYLVENGSTKESILSAIDASNLTKQQKEIARVIASKEFDRLTNEDVVEIKEKAISKTPDISVEKTDKTEEKISFDKELNKKLVDKLKRLYPEIKLEYTEDEIQHVDADGKVMNQEEVSNTVKYSLKAAEALMDWSIAKPSKHGGTAQPVLKTVRLRQEAGVRKRLAGKGVPKEQIDFMFEFMRQNDIGEIDTKDLAEKLLLGLAQNVEIAPVSVESNPVAVMSDGNLTQRKAEELTNALEMQYEAGQITQEELVLNRDAIWNQVPEQIAEYTETTFTNYYKDLTVPGGTNYKEIEISTPKVKAELKGHADFATNEGIGWYRVDDSADQDSTTLRVLEMQSDMFQKMKDEDLAKKLTAPYTGFGSIAGEGVHKDKIPEYESKINELKKRLEILQKVDTASMGIRELTRHEDAVEDTEYDLRLYNGRLATAKEIGANLDRAFHQILNTDNKWVKFFIESIVQNAQRNGYNKIMFPSGKTATKIEGHDSLAERLRKLDAMIDSVRSKKGDYYEKKVKAAQIVPAVDQGLESYFPIGSYVLMDHYDLMVYDSKELAIEALNNRSNIASLQKEKQRLKTEGLEKLAPIEGFYQVRVQNTLKKLYGKDVKTVTDEHGNSWFEVDIDAKRDASVIMLQQQGNSIKGQAVIGEANVGVTGVAGTVLINSLLQSQDTLPHEYAHHYIAWFRDAPIVQEAIKKWGSEESLVQAIGEQAVIQKGDAWNWWKKFTEWIQNRFNKLSDKSKEELRDILTDAFLNREDLSKVGAKKKEPTTEELINVLAPKEKEWATKYKAGELKLTEARSRKFEKLLEKARNKIKAPKKIPVQAQRMQEASINNQASEEEAEAARKRVLAVQNEEKARFSGMSDKDIAEAFASDEVAVSKEFEKEMKEFSKAKDKAVKAKDTEEVFRISDEMVELKRKYEEAKLNYKVISSLDKSVNAISSARENVDGKKASIELDVRGKGNKIDLSKLDPSVRSEFEADVDIMEESLAKMVKSDDFKNATIKSPLRMLIGNDGKYPREVAEAMVLAKYGYLAERLGELAKNDDTQILKMLGNERGRVPSSVRNYMKFVGRFESNEAAGIGRMVMSYLGIEGSEWSDNMLDDRLATDAGATLLAVMEADGYVTRNSKAGSKPLTNKLLDALASASRGNEVDLNKSFGGANVYTIRANEGWVETAKMYQEVLGKVIEPLGLDSFEKMPRNSVKQYDKKFETRNAEGWSNLTSKQQEVLNLAENTAFEITQDSVKLLRGVWGAPVDSIDDVRPSQIEVMKMFGWKNSELFHIDYQDNVKAKNAEIFRSIQDVLAFTEGRTEDVYFDYFFSKNGRFFIDSTKINPQTDKLHRFLIGVKTENKTIDSKASREGFMLAVVQAFDGSKLLDRESRGEDIIVGGEIITDLGAIDKQSQEKSIKSFKALVSDKRVMKVVQGLKDGKFSRKELLEVLDGVDHPSHAMMALIELAKWHPTEAFESNMSMEIDAVNSGFILNLLVNPVMNFDKLTKWLAKGGIWFGDKVPSNYGEWRGTKGNLDSYEEGVEIVNERLPKNYLTSYFGKIVRNTMKYPLMIFVYGGGLNGISRGLTTDYIDDMMNELSIDGTSFEPILNILYEKETTLIDMIQQDKEAGNETKLLEAKLKKVQKIKNWIGSIAEDDKPNETFKNTTISNGIGKTFYDVMFDMVKDTYGDTIGEYLEETFPEVVEMRDTINYSFAGLFGVFKAEFDKRVAKTSGSKSAVDKVLSEMVQEGKVPGIMTVEASKASEKAVIMDKERKSSDKTSDSKDIDTVVEPILNEEGTRRVHPLIYDLVMNPTAGGVTNIHFLDGTLIMKLIEDATGMGVHDAWVAHVNEIVKSGRKYNKNVLELTDSFNMMEMIQAEVLRGINTDANSFWNGVKASIEDKYVNDTEKVDKVYANTTEGLVDSFDRFVDIIDSNKDRMRGMRMTSGHMAGPVGSTYTREASKRSVRVDKAIKYFEGLVDRKLTEDEVADIVLVVNENVSQAKIKEKLATIAEIKICK